MISIYDTSTFKKFNVLIFALLHMCNLKSTVLAHQKCAAQCVLSISTLKVSISTFGHCAVIDLQKISKNRHYWKSIISHFSDSAHQLVPACQFSGLQHEWELRYNRFCKIFCTQLRCNYSQLPLEFAQQPNIFRIHHINLYRHVNFQVYITNGSRDIIDFFQKFWIYWKSIYWKSIISHFSDSAHQVVQACQFSSVQHQ